MVGFLTFQIAFWFRNTGTPTVWFGVVLIFSAIGTLAGNVVGPLVRQQLREERMLIAALGLTAVGGTVAAIFGGRATAALLSAIVGFGAALARLAFDSIVQRDAPDANRGRAFARFETRFQLGWVAAAVVPVIIPIPGWLGFAIVGAISAFAMVSYVGGARYLRQRGELPEKLSRRAWRELQRRRALRQTGAGAPLPPPNHRTDPTRVSDRSARRIAEDRGTIRATSTPSAAGAEVDAGQPEAGRVDLGRRGQQVGRLPQPPQVAVALQHAGHEGVAPLDRLLREGEAEQPLDEDVRLVRLDPAPPGRLGDPGGGGRPGRGRPRRRCGPRSR